MIKIDELNKETQELFRAAVANPLEVDDVNRAFTQPATATSGLIGYDLEAPSKKIYPVLTPLRNRITRVTGGFGIQSNWNVVSGINITNIGIGVEERLRGGINSFATNRYDAGFAELGLEDYITDKAQYASRKYEDVLADCQFMLLQAIMIQEEFLDLGGMSTYGLGQPANAPTCTTAASGGTIADSASYYVAVVPLNLAGYQQIAGWNNGITGHTLNFASPAALVQQVARINADGTTTTYGAGVGKPSAISSICTVGSTGSNKNVINASITPIAGAMGYAWYMGTSSSTAALYLTGVSTTANVTLGTATFPANTANQLLSTLAATDYSANALVYDGILTQVLKSGSGSANYVAAADEQLTSDGAGGITQFNTVFTNMWNEYRLCPDEVYVNAQQYMDITQIVIKNGGAPLIRYNFEAGNSVNPALSSGTAVTSILNPIGGKSVKVTIHPNMAPGTLLFWTDSVPYPNNAIGTIVMKHLRYDYRAIQWMRVHRSEDFGVYFDGVLKNYFPQAFAVITNITSGHA
jgi:hypothetical protein